MRHYILPSLSWRWYMVYFEMPQFAILANLSLHTFLLCFFNRIDRSLTEDILSLKMLH